MLTLLKEIENVLNNFPITVVYYDELIQPLTPNKLLYGCSINTEVLDNNNEEPAQDITKRYIYTKKLLEHFKTRLTNRYLKELSEHHYNRKTKHMVHPNVVDVVLLHDDVLKRCDWKIGEIAELVISNDKSGRAASSGKRIGLGQFNDASIVKPKNNYHKTF